MPEQSHPPYVSGATTIPRQLERWLDINPQNGPLERIKKFFTLPAFNFSCPPYDIVIPYHGVTLNPTLIGAVFNYTSPNVFSLKVSDVEMIVGETHTTVVIASKNADSTLTRYILWQGLPPIPLTIPLYSGQPINKVFRIEVWYSALQTDSVLVESAQTILSSVLGDLDYRYGVDQSLETLTSQVTEQGGFTDVFGVALPANLPMTMPVNTYI